MTTSARAGGLAREVLRVNTAALRGGGVVREVLRVSAGQARIGGLVREVLVQDVKRQARVSGVRREVLLVDAPAQTLLRRSRWFLRVAAPMERDDEDEQDPWYPPRYPVHQGPKTLRPYVSINS
jgi:hypothetical protein